MAELLRRGARSAKYPERPPGCGTRSSATIPPMRPAFSIFMGMSAIILIEMNDSTDMADGSVRARELRVLAERKMGEIQLFEKEYDDIYDNESFDDYDDDLYDGWEWSLFIRDVVIFGTTNDEAAEYLYDLVLEAAAQESPLIPFILL